MGSGTGIKNDRSMNLLHRYTKLPRSIVLLIGANFLVNLVNAAFILILNIYMRKLGYADGQIAAYNSYRFLGVLALGFPLGFFIRGKKLKPFFLTGTTIIPIASYLVLYAIPARIPFLITLGALFWGLGLMFLHVCNLPFIMRAAPDDVISEAISLNFSMWALATIISGAFIAVVSRMESFNFWLWSFQWDEFHILRTIVLFSVPAVFLILRIREAPPRSASNHFLQNIRSIRQAYDWLLIFKALTPTLLIAIGAGLTIPFINLFFNSVFNLDSDDFSLIGSASAALVFFSTLLIPGIKRRFGYRTAILATQWTSIGFLVLMALTELYASLPGALMIAIICFMLRQPLMNMAGPMTSELTMKYVGEKNQELISAITSTAWSASWFISARIFQYLRGLDLHYFQIFIITASLYALGVVLYGMIIREYQQRESDSGAAPAQSAETTAVGSQR